MLGVDSRRLGREEFRTIGHVSEKQKLPLWMTVNIRAMVGRSTLELPNGVRLEDRNPQSSAAGYAYIGGATLGRESAVEAALGGVRLLNRSLQMESLSADRWATLRVDEEDFIRYRTERGRLTTDLDIVFERAPGALRRARLRAGTVRPRVSTRVRIRSPGHRTGRLVVEGR